MADSAPDAAESHFTMTPVAALLREELLTPQNRAIWEQHIHQDNLTEGNALSVRAIARSISEYQNRVYGLNLPDYKYKDRVWRALSAGILTVDTVALFKETFVFSEKSTELITKYLLDDPSQMGLPPGEGNTSQVAVISSFYTIEHVDEPGWVRLTADITLTSLESGCDRIHFYQPGSRDLQVLTPEYLLQMDVAPSTCVVYPRVPYGPLQVFSIRVTCLQEVVPALDGSGVNAVQLPFNIRTSGTCIRFLTGGHLQDVSFKEYSSAKAGKLTSYKTVRTADFYSVYYPLLQEKNIEISWKNSPKEPCEEHLPRILSQG